jgi:hypothetical protein
VDILVLQVSNNTGCHFCSIINVKKDFPKYITEGVIYPLLTFKLSEPNNKGHDFCNFTNVITNYPKYYYITELVL